MGGFILRGFMFNQRLHFFSCFVAASTLVLIIAGGLVTSTGSGLSVPDWPLSYGQFFPPMIGGIRFEHTHRVIAATVGILTLILTCFFLYSEKRVWVKSLSVVALFMVVAQALLGAATVIYLLPDPISVSHACLGQTFFVLLCLLALFTSRQWLQKPTFAVKRAGTIQRLFLTTTFFIFLQLIFGAMVRHTEDHRGLNYHFATAFLILVHVIFIVPKVTKEKEAQVVFLKPLMFLATLVASQIFLGLGSYIYKIVMAPAAMPRTAEVLMTTAHQTNGALILAVTTVLTVSSFRYLTNLKKDKTTSLVGDYISLTKPRLTLLVLASTSLGFLMAGTGSLPTALLFHTLLGCALIGGGINALNQYLERFIDAKMKRTANRPIPSGRLEAQHGLIFGCILTIIGVVYLFALTNALAGFLGVLTVISYVFLYTPLKQKTSLNTFVGAVAGALPCIIGWVARENALPVGAWVIFLILFFWQLPHFFAIAWVYKEDYDGSGLKMLTRQDPDGRATGLKIILSSILLFPFTLLPVWAGIGQQLYSVAAILAGTFFIFAALLLYRRRMVHAKKFVSLSIYYLLILILAMVADKIL